MAGDLLARVISEIETRRDELRPLVAEYERLLTAAQALEEDGRAAPGEGGAKGGSSEGSSEEGAPTPAPATRRRAEKAAPRRRAQRGSAAGAIARAAGRGRTPRAARPARAVSDAAHQAILAALEHGSHTASELSVVTAMSGASIRESLRRLTASGAVARARRDGKAAYALVRSARA